MISFITKIKKYFYIKKWYKCNMHNKTIPVNINKIESIIIGKKTYGAINVTNFSPENIKLIIGSYCSISSGVQFLLGGEHQVNSISTYPFKVQCFGQVKEASSKGNIIVGDDVWIGTNAIICSGVKIGQGAVIAAGAIVTKNVEPYAIFGGNPAKLIRYRFEENIREKLLQIDICKLFDSFKKDNIDLIYSPLTLEKLEEIIDMKNIKKE